MFSHRQDPPRRYLLCRPMPARAGRTSPRGIRRSVLGDSLFPLISYIMTAL
jgi:hypothetical protein